MSQRPGNRHHELVDSRDGYDAEAVREDAIRTIGLSASEFETRTTTPIPLSVPGTPVVSGHGAVPRVEVPATPMPPASMRADDTDPFNAVLAVPGQKTTHIGGLPMHTTLGFRGVLPMPAARSPRPVVVPEGAFTMGAVVGGFTLVAKLDSDTAFVRFRATHPAHGDCVLEVVRPEAAPHAQGLLLDGRLRTTLDDPRIPGVYALGARPLPWAAMAYPQGEGLFASGTLTSLGDTRLAHVLLDLAEALAHGHARRVVHGDLQPDDILVSKGDQICLTGYGRPTAIGVTGARRAFPGGPQLGTAPFTPPEAFAGETPDAAWDVYAAGAILYTGLVGSPPFTGSSTDIRRGVLDHYPALPREAEGTLRHALFGLARACLTKRGADRPTADDLAEGLRAALDRPIHAGRAPGAGLVPALLIATLLSVGGAIAVALLTR